MATSKGPKSALEIFEDAAILGAEAVREFLVYRGQNRDYRDRARVGVGAMAAYTRLRGTVANERQLEIIERRQDVFEKVNPRRRLAHGEGA